MAPFAFDLLDEEQKKKEQEQPGMGAPAMTGGGESFGGATQQPTQQEKGTNRQGSGFVGLDKYMSANQGNNFGGQVTGKVRGNVDTAKQTLDQSVNAFTQASNQGAVKWNDVQDQTKGIIDSAGDNMAQDDVSKVKEYAGAKYQGPENFLGSAYGTQAQGAVQKASQQANALQSEGGRFALLDQFFGRPKYSMGEKSLDNLLVQNAPGVAARAQSIGGQAKQLAGTAGQKTQELDNLAAGNKFATQDTAKQTKDYLGNALTGFQTDLRKRYEDSAAANETYNQARRADLSDDAFDTDTFGVLGLNEGANLYDVDLSKYLQDNPQGSVGEFANDQDYARYLALSQLAGEDPSLLVEADRAKAGTANGRVSADAEKLKQDIAARGGAYNSELSEGTAQRQARISGLEQNVQRMMEQFGPSSGEVQSAYGALQSAKQELQNWTGSVNSKYKADRKASKAGG